MGKMINKGKNASLVLTQYPIIDSLREELHSNLGVDLDFLVVSTLAADGYSGLLSYLRQKHYQRIYVYIPDETVSPLATILIVLSFFIPASSRFLVSSGKDIQKYHLTRGLIGFASLCGSVVQGAFVMLSMQIRARYLQSVDRINFHRLEPEAPASDFAYLRTNLWLGVQAGGALTHTWGVIGALLRKGAKVRYLSADVRGSNVEGDFSYIQIKPKNTYVIPRELNHFLYHRNFYRSANQHLTDFSGTIYQRVSIGNFAGVELSRRRKVPLIVEYNGSESWLSRNWGTPFTFSGLVALAEDVSLHHAHMIVTVSEPLKHELVERGFEEDRIVVYPNGVDPDAFDPALFSKNMIADTRKKLGIPANAVLVSFVGTFGPWHGAEILASAAKKLIDHRSDGVEVKEYFLFIGDGVRRPEVEAFTGDLIKKGRVILTGLVDPSAIPSYLAASDILVAPTVQNPDKSAFFGSPTKLFEYMAAGKPIIASQIGQIGEILAGSLTVSELSSRQNKENDFSDNGIGILTSPGSVNELCTAIRFLTANPKYRTTWGARARQHVLSRYTWDHHVTAITNKLEEIFANENAGKITVLLNGLHSKSGGGVTYLRNVLPYLCSDQRLEIHICLDEKQLALFQSTIGKATLHKVTVKGSLWRTILYEQFSLPGLARRIKADVTFSPANYGPLLAPNTVVLLRNALSVAFVERRITKVMYWAMIYVGTLFSVFVARNVISVSEYARKATVTGMFDWAPRKFQTIPHGVNEDFTATSVGERSETNLLCVSDIYVQKNLHTLFKALPKIRNRFPDVTLKIAGAALDPQYLTRLKHLSEHENVADVVDFVGSVDVDTLQELYDSCAVFVFPSTVETFGNPLVEAMACGCPIATSNTAAMPEVAGDTAAYFNPHDADDMARVIIDLLENPDKREALGKRAVERAKMYSWEETARKTADVLIDAAQR